MRDTIAEALIFAIIVWFMTWVIDLLLSYASPGIESPCTVYNNQTISQIPARYIQYFINQNEKN
jgi:hypothetical protein